MNQARALHEATQLALKGHKVVMLCPDLDCGRGLAATLIKSVAHVSLLYTDPRICTHYPNEPGWAVRFRNQGEVFFTSGFSLDDTYFECLFKLRPFEEVRKEVMSQGISPTHIPSEWEPVISLIRIPAYVSSRYERVLANLRELWATSL